MATNRSSSLGSPNPASTASTSQQSQYYAPTPIPPKTKAGPNRSTKAGGKLKILPEEPEEIIALTRPAATLRAVPAVGGGGSKPASGPIPSPRPPTQTTVSSTVLPATHEEEEDDDDDDDDSSEDEDAYAAARVAAASKQLAQIPEGSMRRDARRLTRKARANLPRVTAYSTATSYRMRDLAKFLHARRDSHRTNPMTFDECVYTTYTYELVDEARGINSSSSGAGGGGGGQNGHGRKNSQAPPSPSAMRPSHYSRTGDLLGIPELNGEEEGGADTKRPDSNGSSTLVDTSTSGEDPFADKSDGRDHQAQEAFRREELKRKRRERFTVHGVVPEVFFMEYGTVVIWGMTLAQEKRLLRELRRFEVEKLAQEDVESEDLNWYLADYSRIYNDVITLRRGSSYMTKLSLSHALAQSTKISFFEGIIDNTIETTKDIPQSIAESGKIGMPPAEIMKQIGHLFILRMNIHLVGSIVDSPEIFWAQPDLEPLYSAARSYLEIPQRIDLLNTRVEVLQDMLQLLKDQVTSSHSEWLEIIVIVLIGLEIILGVATMIVDLYFA